MVTFARGVRIAFAGGGTGGHLFPAVAVMERIRRRHPGSRFLLHATGRPSERSLPVPGFVEREVVASPRPGPGFRGRAMFPGRLARAIGGASRSLRVFRPDCVVGLGGYGSVASVLAAHALRRPVVLLEQNAVPGRANRALARCSRAVGVAFSEAASSFPGRARMTGNPVRASIPGRARRPETFGLDASSPVLGVVGGSLGASILNRAIIDAAEDLAAAGVQLLCATGPADRCAVARACERAGVRACVLPFVEDMGAFYAVSDVVLARAGGTTVAELAAAGTPSVLVPLMIHADGHQVRNARAVAAVGGAIVTDEMSLSLRGIAREVLPILRDGHRLARMVLSLRRFARPEATDAVADLVLQIAREGAR
jgi:UDP-N-acetylglucosamine--N-acetylmuramyl-(pentapeptide) pyrophosphoryl-undecaprenol N-acetylglucosamine transferase